MEIRQFLPLVVFAGAALLGPAVAPAGDTEEGVTPFERIVTVPAVRNRNQIDYVATDAKARQIAFAIGSYVAAYDESALLGSDVIQGGNWVLGGFEGTGVPGTDEFDAGVEEAILEVPTPWFIVPEDPASGVKKVSLVEMCNRNFASVALGVTPVVAGDDSTRIINGVIHAPALPCEVSVYSDGKNIKVDMLNAEAIFTLFFTDVLFGAQMSNPAFAAEIVNLPTQVKSEIQAIVIAALDHAGIKYEVEFEPKGPVYETLDEVADAVLASPQDSPFVHFTYTKAGGGSFSPADVSHVAQTIINTMTINGEPGAGIHDPALDAMLSEGSLWRAARPAPLSMPGGNKVIEACSPRYAKLAMSTGLHHATALPCEIAVNTIDGGNTLLISFLDPHFMFTALFSDAFKRMTDEELAAFAELPSLVLGDLQTIVQYALDYNLVDFSLEAQGQIWYDMLPHL